MNRILQTELHVLMQTAQPPGLGSGPRAHVLAAEVIQARIDELASEHGLPAQRRRLLEALMLLWHDHLHAAHAVVQDMPDADAALIHGIVHRREPDYWNAKYWFRRVGQHPVYGPLGAAAQQLAMAAGLAEWPGRFCPGGEWEPAGFVDFVQACAALDPDDPGPRLALALQDRESRLLLAHLLGKGV